MAEPLPHEPSPLSDQQLLEQFSRTRDAEAFRELVVRHSPLVLATCRRGLHSSADADDAFQATFLVLARSAAKIRHRPALGAWLYGVATRVCLRMRRDTARRTTQELLDTAAEPMDPLDELLARHDEMVVDEELRRLPSSLRDPIVLRYLGNQSNTEVARQLGLSITALEGRLKRGKQQLRMRLIRRGVTLVAVVATLKATRVAASEVPMGLVDSAVALGTTTAATASAAATTSTSSSTSQIAFQELHAMNTLVALKPAALALSACGIAAAVMVASQVGMTPFASAQSGGGTTIELAVNEEGSPGAAADPPAVTVEVPGQRVIEAAADPFGGEMAPAGGFGRGGYGGEGGFPGEMGNPYGGGPEFGAGGMAPGAMNESPLPHVVDLKPRSATETRIEQALRKPLSNVGLNFTETPLSEIASFLRDEYEMEVQIDIRALEDLGLAPDNPMTVNLRNIQLDSALDLMLSQHDLTYIIHNEVLLITSEYRAMSTLEPRAYPIDVIQGQGVEKLVEVIQSTVAPDTWKEELGGGEGAIAIIGNRLVVRQTYAVHREINALLSQLRDTTPENSPIPGMPGGMQRY